MRRPSRGFRRRFSTPRVRIAIKRTRSDRTSFEAPWSESPLWSRCSACAPSSRPRPPRIEIDRLAKRRRTRRSRTPSWNRQGSKPDDDREIDRLSIRETGENPKRSARSTLDRAKRKAYSIAVLANRFRETKKAPSSSLVRTQDFQSCNTGSNPVGVTDRFFSRPACSSGPPRSRRASGRYSRLRAR